MHEAARRTRLGNERTALQPACVFSRCAASIQATEEQELTAEQVQQRQAWIDDALTTLHRSITAGWKDLDHMQRDQDLAILREMPKFRALMPQED